jgi:putative DNA primase/helicase
MIGSSPFTTGFSEKLFHNQDDFQMNIDFAALIEPVAMRLFGDRYNARLSKPGVDLRFGTHGSLSINPKTGEWFDHEENKGGGVIDLVMRERDCAKPEAMEWLRSEGQIPARPNGNGARSARKIASTHDYVDEDGTVLSRAIRYDPKAFTQCRPDGNGGWIHNLDGVRPVPYRLPEVIEAVANCHPILIVEGEAKADLLAKWNVTATCNAGGAKNWRPDHSAFLRGADVVLVPDNDKPGWEHIHIVGASLSGIANSIRVLALPGLSPKGDIVDWAKAGGTREQLDGLIARAPNWKPVAEKLADLETEKKTGAARSEDELLDALARMPKGVEFGRERKRLQKQLGVSRDDIDAEIEVRREENETKALLHGHWAVEPWPELVDGDSLIRDIIRKIRKHVVMSHENALAIALWIMGTWVHEQVATHSPILDITSAEPESGKSTTLGLISFLLPRCVSSVEISEAALYRAIELWQPSFAIDEFDSVLVGDDKTGLRSVINSGHTRGQTFVRCVGEDKEPKQFKTFAPKCIGMIGRKLPPATLSRCIIVELRRRKKDEQVEKFKHVDDAELGDLRGRLLRWSMDNEEVLRTATVAMPEGFENRHGDNWRTQFAIADLAGADWGDQARFVAARIVADSDSRTVNTRALTDIRAVFYGDGGEPLERMSSVELVAQLCAHPDSPWSEWRNGKPITQAQLARVLKPFRIAPEVIRLQGGGTPRGYVRSQFEDAWERYLPGPPFEGATRNKRDEH